MSEMDPFAFERIVIQDPDSSLELRQLIPDDAAAYFDLVNFDRPHLSRFGDDTATRYPTANSVLENIVNPTDPNQYRFGMWVDEVMVGSNNITLEGNGVAEVSSWVGAQYIGNNYADRARKILCTFAFKKLGVQKIISMVDAANIASCRSVEKSGFKLQAVHSSTCVYTLAKQSE